MNSQVILVTTTSSDVMDYRAHLAVKTCEEAKRYGYEILVVDKSSCQEFSSRLSAANASVIQQKGETMGASRRECIRYGISREKR
jgi:hypothetical protein